MRWYWWALLVWVAWAPFLLALRALLVIRRANQVLRFTGGIVRPEHSIREWDGDGLACLVCPACYRTLALRQAYPRLSEDQVEAIVTRQIALGTCEPHERIEEEA